MHALCRENKQVPLGAGGCLQLRFFLARGKAARSTKERASGGVVLLALASPLSCPGPSAEKFPGRTHKGSVRARSLHLLGHPPESTTTA